MNKILIVAKREYKAMVGTKAFLIGLAVMPLLILGSIAIPSLLRDRVDLKEKRVVVIGGDELIFQGLKKVTDERNKNQTTDKETGKQNKPLYIIERPSSSATGDELRLELSDAVRKQNLYAFVEIATDDGKSPTLLDAITNPEEAAKPRVEIYYHSQDNALAECRRFITETLRQIVRFTEFGKSGIDMTAVLRAELVTIESRGLYKQMPNGEILRPETENELMKLLIPFGVMMFMFMILVMSIQPLLDGVIEEKGLRIAEVLLGSLTPTQLMAGKLLGILGCSFTILSLYLGSALGVAAYHDQLDKIPLRILPWFFLFEILAILFFGAIFLSVGACVSQLKEAQGLLLPLWVVISSPMFAWMIVIREPMSQLSTTLSLIPPLIPMLMTLRISATESVPLWQPLVGALIMLGATGMVIFVAGRIFRIGILTQGNTPKPSEILKWAFKG